MSRSRSPPLTILFPYTTLFRSRFGGETDEDLLRPAPPTEVGDDVDRALQLEDESLLLLLDFLERRLRRPVVRDGGVHRSEEHTSELQSQSNLVWRLLLEKKTIE